MCVADDQGLVLPPEVVGSHPPAQPVRSYELAKLGEQEPDQLVVDGLVLEETDSSAVKIN